MLIKYYFPNHLQIQINDSIIEKLSCIISAGGYNLSWEREEILSSSSWA